MVRRKKTVLDSADLMIRRVLVLEDDKDLAETLKTLLESHHFVVTTAPDGVSGIKEILAEDFDVIVCDMVMPKMPGDMFYLGVSRVKEYLCDRFIFVTAHYQNPKISKFLETVPNQVFYKPVPIRDLLAGIGKVLQQTKKNQKPEEVWAK